jgi:hypothetical protein
VTVLSKWEASVKAGGDAKGKITADGAVYVQAGGTMSQTVTAKGDVRVEAVAAVAGAAIKSSDGDVWIVSNGPLSGTAEGKWVADARTTSPTADNSMTVKTTGTTAQAQDTPTQQSDSPWARRNREIVAQLAVLTAAGQGNSEDANKLRAEQELLALQSAGLTLNEQAIPADRVRDLLTNNLFVLNQTRPAYEYQGPAITYTFWWDLTGGWDSKTYQTAGYVIFTDVTGLDGQTWVLEPFRVEHVPAWTEYVYQGPNVGVVAVHHPAHDVFHSLLGDPNASQRADFYKVVRRISVPLNGQTPLQFCTNVRTQGYADTVIAGTVNLIHGQTLETNDAVIDIGLSLLPLVGTANEIAKNGLTWDAALSFGEDVTTFLGVGAALKAKRVASAVARTSKLAKDACKSTRVAVGAEVFVNGVGAVVSGHRALGADSNGEALGYFGDATLRLFGASAVTEICRCLLSGHLHAYSSAPVRGQAGRRVDRTGLRRARGCRALLPNRRSGPRGLPQVSVPPVPAAPDPVSSGPGYRPPVRRDRVRVRRGPGRVRVGRRPARRARVRDPGELRVHAQPGERGVPAGRRRPRPRGRVRPAVGAPDRPAGRVRPGGRGRARLPRPVRTGVGGPRDDGRRRPRRDRFVTLCAARKTRSDVPLEPSAANADCRERRPFVRAGTGRSEGNITGILPARGQPP